MQSPVRGPEKHSTGITTQRLIMSVYVVSKAGDRGSGRYKTYQAQVVIPGGGFEDGRLVDALKNISIPVHAGPGEVAEAERIAWGAITKGCYITAVWCPEDERSAAGL